MVVDRPIGISLILSISGAAGFNTRIPAPLSVIIKTGIAAFS
jgi:hypothetical protein